MDFINHAFSLTTLDRVRCPCNRHNCGRSLTKWDIVKDLVDHGFMPDYEIWTFHGEKETRVETEVKVEPGDEEVDVDWIDEMLEAL